MTTRQTAINARVAEVLKYNPVSGNYLSDAKDVLLKFLQEFFYQMPRNKNLFHFDPGEGWQTDELTSEVIITDSGAMNTDTLEKRPAIIVSRNQFAYANLGLDNLVKVTGVNDLRTHSDLLQGSFSINCVSKLGLEAEKLALLVTRALKSHRRLLQQAGFFQIGQNITVGPENPAASIFPGDSDEDYVLVTVTFPCYWQDVWSVNPTGLTVINSIKLTVNSIERKFDGSLLYPDSINSNGTINESSNGVIVQTWTA